MPETSTTHARLLRKSVCRRPSKTGSAVAIGTIVLLVLAVPLPSHATGQDTASEQRAAELERLRNRIQQLQSGLNKTIDRRDSEREELRKLDVEIGGLVRTLRDLDTRLQAQGARLETLRKHQRLARSQLQRQHDTLARQIRATFVLGRQEYVKLLLSQDDPAAVSRVLTYYQYLGRARAQQIAGARVVLDRLHNLEEDVGQQRRELQTLRTAKLERKQALEVAHARRTEVLATLGRKVHDQTDEIARLRADEQRLQRLLEQLEDYLAGVPRDPSFDIRFRDFRGKLPLPTQGKFLAHFGDPKKGGNLRWKGVLLGGHEGQDVISVARGRVAFADWLRGFGLLLILEHGDGYMTLYGYNQSLYTQVGDWVEAGQVIASLGNTGDVPEAGVYFEIRHQGQPRDPQQWLRKR
jgi:septal ring factor EnvC (AmiA/AmiB activator)